LIEEAKTITPCEFHEPPRPSGASQNVWASPPTAGIFRSFPPVKKAIHWLLGDQNGKIAPSVLKNSYATRESVWRSHKLDLPSTDLAEKTKRVPSGDKA